MNKIKRKTIELDAANQTPGRLASKVAGILMGKNKTGYLPYIDSGDRVVIKNVEQIYFSGKKLDQKVYFSHSLHPGGLKRIPAKKVLKENPRQVLIHAVERMLPKNKLRTARMLRLKFK